MTIVMGNSIANDPCYGGELFYGDSDRRQRALEVLRNMRKEGKHPLSKVPHLGDPELDNYIPNTSAVTAEAQSMGSDKSNGVCVEAKAEVVGGTGEAVERIHFVMDADRHTVTEAGAGAGSDKGQDGVAAVQTTRSSVPLVPALAPTPTVDDKSSVSVIVMAAKKDIIESETVVEVAGELTETNRNSAAVTSVTPGIEEETEAKVGVEVEVEVQGRTETDKEYLVRTCRYGSTLKYTTPHYTKLHYITLRYNTIHYTAVHYTALHYATLHYTTLRHTTLHYTATYCTVLLYNSLSLPGTYCVGTVGKRRKVKS
jgi:hypothetical protein